MRDIEKYGANLETRLRFIGQNPRSGLSKPKIPTGVGKLKKLMGNLLKVTDNGFNQERSAVFLAIFKT
jgi:hypothetical protein